LKYSFSKINQIVEFRQFSDNYQPKALKMKIAFLVTGCLMPPFQFTST